MIVNAKQYNRPRDLLDPSHSTRMTTKSSVAGGLMNNIDIWSIKRRFSITVEWFQNHYVFSIFIDPAFDLNGSQIRSTSNLTSNGKSCFLGRPLHKGFEAYRSIARVCVCSRFIYVDLVSGRNLPCPFVRPRVYRLRDGLDPTDERCPFVQNPVTGPNISIVSVLGDSAVFF